MKATIEVQVEHLGGPSFCRVESDLEPNEAAWNDHTFEVMARGLNRLLTAVFDERDMIRFENERRELRTPAAEPAAKS